MMNILWVGAATVVITFHDLKIAVDPVLCEKGTVQDYRFFKSRRLSDPVYDKDTFSNIDILLLTHTHMDHFDSDAQRLISADIAIAGTPGVSVNASQSYVLKNYQSFTRRIKSVTVTVSAIPAVHGTSRFAGKLVGENCGYLVELCKDNELKTIYITGDDVFRKKNAFVGRHKLDLIIADAGGARVGDGLAGILLGRITNNRSDIRRLAKAYAPEKLLPVHWGTFSHYVDGEYKSGDFDDSITVIEPGESIGF